MSTLNITPRCDDRADTASGADEIDARFDARFDALVRGAGDHGSHGHDDHAAAPVEFATVFDLDYGQRRLALVVPQQRRGALPTAARPRRTAPVRAVTARRPMRLTRRGRAVAVLSFLALSLTLMLTLGGFSAVASLDGGTPPPVRVVTVQAGDTLYDIASDLAAPGEIREMVLKIQDLNSLSSSSLEEGQKLAVPRG